LGNSGLASDQSAATYSGVRPSALTRSKTPLVEAAFKPVCVGSGFVALDLVLIGNDQSEPSFALAGGSCGNVLTILAYLGWDAVPVLRLKDDDEAQKLVADLERWSVNTSFIRQDRNGITPVVVQRICTAINGDRYHRFEWKAPVTGVSLPRYRPLPERIALEVSTQLPQPQVFFFDRPAKSALFLARQAKERGALVFFEPTSIGERDVFKECLEVADVLKYSAERIDSLSHLGKIVRPSLEIQTHGDEGLRYSLESGAQKRVWKRLAAIPVTAFKDAAGAGDWCTAGILDVLGRKGRAWFLNASDRQISSAIRHGQSLASVNCSFEGARGAMYRLSKAQLEIEAATLLTTTDGRTKA
jgi:fructokinase